MSPNPFIERIWAAAQQKAAALRAEPRNGNSHCILWLADERVDSQWMLEEIVHAARSRACRRFASLSNRTRHGYLVHVVPDGRVCCFVGCS